MDTTTDSEHDATEVPTSGDGFHEPDDSVKRRNLITAAVIVALLSAWVLYGLRHALF